MLSLLGKLTSGTIGWVLPGFSPFIAYGIAALSIAGLIGGTAYIKGAEGRSAAVAAERASCEIRIANMKTASETALSDLVAEINQDSPPQPVTSDEVTKLCSSQAALCRDGGAK
jgi:hypothetical protein